MKISITKTALQDAINAAMRLAPPISANVTLESDGKRLMLHSASEVNRCSLVVPCQVEGKARFAINLITLKEATKGRDEMEIVFDKTLCKISSKGFKIELPTFDALEIEAEKDTEKASVFKITSDQATWLSEALHAVALQPLKLVSKYMPLYIKLTDKGVFLTCYDDLHLAFVSSKEITGDMEVTLPIDVIAVVLDTFSASGFTMSVSSSSLEVSNKLARVSMSLPETSEGIQGSDVYDKSREILKAKGTEIISSRTDVLNFLDNARAVASNERSEVTLNTTSGKLKLGVATSNGTARALMKANVKGDNKAVIDFDFFDEAIRKSTAEVNMQLVDDSFIAFKIANATLVVALNQE